MVHLLVLIFIWWLHFKLQFIIIKAFVLFPPILLPESNPVPRNYFANLHLQPQKFSFIFRPPLQQQQFFIIYLINFTPFLFPRPTIFLKLFPIHFLCSFGNIGILFLQLQLQNILQDIYNRYLEPNQFVYILFVSSVRTNQGNCQKKIQKA